MADEQKAAERGPKRVLEHLQTKNKDLVTGKKETFQRVGSRVTPMIRPMTREAYEGYFQPVYGRHFERTKEQRRDDPKFVQWALERPAFRDQWSKAADAGEMLSPALFAYSDAWSRGRKPESDIADYSEEQIQTNRVFRQLEMDLRPHKGNFRDVNWTKGASGPIDDSDEVGPFEQPPLPISSKEVEAENPEDSAGKALSMAQKIRSGRTSETDYRKRKTIQSEWDRRVALGHEGTQLPQGFSLHPDRPWTLDDEDELLDRMHDDQAEDIETVARELQRTVEQCHRMYRYLACLEFENPETGAWTGEEDAMLRRLVQEYESRDRNRIAFWLHRTNEDCQSRWTWLEKSDQRGQTIEELAHTHSKGDTAAWSEAATKSSKAQKTQTSGMLKRRQEELESQTDERPMKMVRLAEVPRPSQPIWVGSITYTNSFKRKRTLEDDGGDMQGQDREQQGMIFVEEINENAWDIY